MMKIQKPKADLYISVDVETTGDVPGINSLLSIGAVPFYRSGNILENAPFSMNLEPLEGAVMDPETQEFWNLWPGAYHEATRAPQNPAVVMVTFANWLVDVQKNQDNHNLVFVGYPATFDFGFINYYFKRFVGYNPFGFVGLDLKTLGMAILDIQRFKKSNKKNFPNEWTEENHTHRALDDAIDQAKLAVRMFAALDELHKDARITRGFLGA